MDGPLQVPVLGLLCGVALLVLLGVRTCLVMVTVYGQSMAPTLAQGDRVLALRRFPRTWIRTGRIVLVNPCGQERTGRAGWEAVCLQIKRVVAMEGETVTASAGEVRRIPPQHLFVCGDNREHSIDSRIWGPLPLCSVSGLLLLRWPHTSAHMTQPALLSSPGLPARQAAPPFTARMLDGQIVTLEHYRGRTVLLLFLTVSELVRTRMPAYLALARGAAARQASLLLVYDCSIASARAFVQPWDGLLPVAVAPTGTNPFFHAYRITSVPGYCLITPQGRVEQAGRADDSLASWRQLVTTWTLRQAEQDRDALP